MMAACTTEPIMPVPTIAAAKRATLAMLPLVSLRLRQHFRSVLEHVGDRAVQVLRQARDELLELGRAAEIDLGRSDAAALALLGGELGAPLLRRPRLPCGALPFAWRSGEHLGKAVDFVDHAALALTAFFSAAFTSIQRLSISSAARLSFSGPVLPDVIALTNGTRWEIDWFATGTFHEAKRPLACSTSFASCGDLSLMTTRNGTWRSWQIWMQSCEALRSSPLALIGMMTSV